MSADMEDLRNRDLIYRQQKRERRHRFDELFKVTVDGVLILETSRYGDAISKARSVSSGSVVFVTDERGVVIFTRTLTH